MSGGVKSLKCELNYSNGSAVYGILPKTPEEIKLGILGAWQVPANKLQILFDTWFAHPDRQSLSLCFYKTGNKSVQFTLAEALAPDFKAKFKAALNPHWPKFSYYCQEIDKLTISSRQ